MQYSNFDFLSEEYPLLHNLAQAAEYNLYQDPSTSLYKLRQFGEYMTAQIFDTYGIDLPEKDTFQARIYTLKNQGFLPLSIEDYFNIIRRKGNVAVHQYSATTEGAALTLSAAFKLAKWFYAAYSVKNINIQGLTFEQPTNLDSRHALHTLETELASIKTQYEALLSQTKEVSAAQQAAFTERAKRSASNLEMSEAETRSIIDQQLVMAGW